MYKAITFNDEFLNLKEFEFPRHVIFFNNAINYSLLNRSDCYKVLLAFLEPEPFRVSNKEVMSNASKFDLILTSDEYLLNNCKNSVKFLFWDTWVYDFDTTKYTKEFKISFICGNKCELEGHKLRQTIWKRQEEIKMKREFWASSFGAPSSKNKIYPSKKDKSLLFTDCQFHLTIENSQYKNYFTEKICDCFATKTIPVYWGCPNISEFFNMDGVIVFNSVEELFSKLNSLDDSYYQKHIEAVNENYSIIKRNFRPIRDRIKEVVDTQWKQTLINGF